MVCFVHDRRYLSKFHSTVNQLRQRNEFTVLTLRQLPKQCCSCSEKNSDTTSMNIDDLRLLCLQTDLKHYNATTNALSEPFKIQHYTVLPFPALFTSKQQEGISNEFIAQHENQLSSLEQMHHARLEFITSTTSEDLLKEVVHQQYNLVTKCSNYAEAIQATYGFWVIISTDDPSRIDLVKHALQKQWMRFITNVDIYESNMIYNWREHLLSVVTHKKISNHRQTGIKQQKMLKKLNAKHQAKQSIQKAIKTMQQNILVEIEDEREETNDYLVENLLMTDPKLAFLCNRFQNCNKSRPPRTHRRQHLLALAMVA